MNENVKILRPLSFFHVMEAWHQCSVVPECNRWTIAHQIVLGHSTYKLATEMKKDGKCHKCPTISGLRLDLLESLDTNAFWSHKDMWTADIEICLKCPVTMEPSSQKEIMNFRGFSDQWRNNHEHMNNITFRFNPLTASSFGGVWD